MIVPHHFAHKTVYVVGLGKTGLSLLSALREAHANIRAWDDVPENRKSALDHGFTLSPPDAVKWNECVALFLSPGISDALPTPHPSAVLARQHNVPVLCDVELLFQECPKNIFIGITGSNGKSTTTALITHILSQAGHRAYAAGNIGTPVLDLPLSDPKAIYVIELSSYQLERIKTRALSVSVLLNLSPNHLDRHGDMLGYLTAKEHIFHLTKDTGTRILGVDSPDLEALFHKDPKRYLPISNNLALTKGIYVIHNHLHDHWHSPHHVVMDVRDAATLQGSHNQQNIAAAYAAIKAVLPDFSDAAFAEGVLSYPSLPHRQEHIGTRGSLTFINDSKATTLEAALLSIKAHHNIYWIMGGQAKKGWQDVSALVPYASHIHQAYLIGESAAGYAGVLSPFLKVTDCGTLEKAFQKAVKDAQSSSEPAIILLAPACASWDQFKSFEHRGDVFRTLSRIFMET